MMRQGKHLLPDFLCNYFQGKGAFMNVQMTHNLQMQKENKVRNERLAGCDLTALPEKVSGEGHPL